MIEEITRIRCDNCGKVIIGFPWRLLVREYKKFAKKYCFTTVTTKSGRKDFCNETCYKEWLNKS